MIAFKLILSFAFLAIAASEALFSDTIDLPTRGDVPREVEAHWDEDSRQGRVDIHGPNGRARVDVELNKDERVGQMLQRWYQALKNYSEEMKQELRNQGLNDDQILEKFQNFGAKLRKLRAEGRTYEEIYWEIRNFIASNKLESIHDGYMNRLRDEIRDRSKDVRLGKFENKVEDWVEEKGGVGPALGQAEHNYKQFQSNGGVQNVVRQAVQIGSSQGGIGVLLGRLRGILEQWGLEEHFDTLIQLIQRMVGMFMMGSPFGMAINAALPFLGGGGSLNLAGLGLDLSGKVYI